MSTTNESPRIYVACLAAYNAGTLHGAWIDADQDADAINEEIQAILKSSPEPDAEEFAIHEYDGFAGWKVGEYEKIETVAAAAQAIAEHGEPFALWLNSEPDYNLPEDVRKFTDAYRGEYKDEQTFGEEWAGELYTEEQLGPLAAYINWEKYGNELFMGLHQHQKQPVHDFRL